MSAPRAEPSPPLRGLSGTSVPAILLGLGALCLLVAALVFLAVTWSVMGVGARTATLVGFTALAGGVAALAARRGLRAASESLSVVALGLLAFDVAGARDAGWLGDLGESGFLLLLGSTLTLVAGSVAVAASRTPIARVVGAEILGVLGAMTAAVGLLMGDWPTTSASLAAVVVVGAATATTAHRLRLRTLTLGLGLLAGIAWTSLVVTGLDRALSHPEVGELWGDLEVWPLLSASALVGVPALLSAVVGWVRVLAAATALVVAAIVVLVPFTVGTSTELTLAVVALVAVGSALAWFVPRPWAAAAMAAPALGASFLACLCFLLLAQGAAALAWAGARLWRGTFDGRLPDWALEHPAPWLLPLATITVLGAGATWARSSSTADLLLSPFARLPLVLSAVGFSLAGALASYPVPVWSVLIVVVAAALGLVTRAVMTREVLPLALGAAAGSVGVGTSLYDDGLSLITLVVTVGLAAATHLRWPGTAVSAIAGAVGVVALTGALWAAGSLAGVEPTWVAAGLLPVLGGLVIGAPIAASRRRGPYGSTAVASLPGRFVGLEAAALASGFVVAAAAVATTTYDLRPTWTAAYLTAGGVLSCLVALLRVERRHVGWLGGGLLAAATWVRLWDTGVETPEAYTLPSALALAVVGVLHLGRHPSSSTMRALAPGLSLASVPSLLWVLQQPDTLRAALLGLGALAVLAWGARVRWTAPVVFGAVVGALVVVRQLAPVVDAVPQWTLIGSAGALLVAMGVSWERRVQDARAAYGYVRGLR